MSRPAERFEERSWFDEPQDEDFAYAESVQRRVEDEGSSIIFGCQIALMWLAGICILFWACTAPTIGG